MTRTKVEFRTSKSVIPAGTILDDKELKKHFSSKEIEDFKNDKYLEEIIIPNIDVKSTSKENKTTESKVDTVEIIHLDEMNDEQIQQYAQELGIDITSLEDSDEVYNAITDFDYASLKVGPLKKFAQIVGANIEGKTLKDEYLVAISEVLKIDDDSGDE